MIKCFFHSSDLDGHCSGAIVKYKYPDAELFGINYGQPFPYDKISKEDTIIMVDFSLQPFSEMVKLWKFVEESGHLVWIDHHVSSLKDANKTIVGNDNNFESVCNGKRQNGKAGCELTWEYFFSNEKMPFAVSLLGRYDVWDLQEMVLPFQFGFRLNETWPTNQELWQKFFKEDWDEGSNDDLVMDTFRNGELILKYQKQENEKYSKSCAFEVKFEGYNAICINKLLTNSQLFESVYDPEGHDIMISFGLRSNGIWTMSFYTTKDDVDCSSIAKKFGGGGHKQAAGCNFKQLPHQFIKQIKSLQPIKFKEIPDYGEHFTISEFREDVSHGMYIDSDGVGYYATKDKMTDIPILPSHFASNRIDNRFEYVVWFNK